MWLDGHVIGVWLEDQKRSMVEVLLFEEPDKRVSVQVEAQAQCLGRFLEHDPVVVQIRLYPDDLHPKTPFTMARRP